DPKDVLPHVDTDQHGKRGDPDPLMGRPHDEDTTVTMPDDPVRRRVTSMQRFVEVRGGAYFFMPSVSALRFLGHADLFE
ncbi:MAG: hypothetical protein ABEK75_03485, partial [Salinibacter sp.]